MSATDTMLWPERVGVRPAQPREQCMESENLKDLGAVTKAGRL